MLIFFYQLLLIRRPINTYLHSPNAMYVKNITKLCDENVENFWNLIVIISFIIYGSSSPIPL